MTNEQRNAITVANLMAKQYHQFHEIEYKNIQAASQQVINKRVVIVSKTECKGICRLSPTQHCIGCGRHVSEME